MSYNQIKHRICCSLNVLMLMFNFENVMTAKIILTSVVLFLDVNPLMLF
jgi:hypothetical protein